MRRRYVGHQAPLEAGAQAVVQGGHIQRGPVGGDDDLVAGLVDAVEGVEELVLGLLLAGDELDVVHQKQVDLAVLVAEFLRGAALDGAHQLIGKLVALDVDDGLVRPALVDGVADGQQQVGLAEAGIAVDKERVVGLAGILRHGGGGRVGEAVGVAHDEVVKGVARHLRQGVFPFGEHFGKLVLRDDEHLKVLGKQIGERSLDPVRKALLQNVLLEVRRGAQHQTAVVQLCGRAVGKPGVHGRLRQLAGQNVQHFLPDVLYGIHSIFHPRSQIS